MPTRCNTSYDYFICQTNQQQIKSLKYSTEFRFSQRTVSVIY